MSAPELKPCPAGSRAAVYAWRECRPKGQRPGQPIWKARVEAESGWHGPTVSRRSCADAEAKAICAWNRRTPSSDWPSLRRMEREEVSDES